MDTLVPVLWVVVALSAMITAVASVATYRVRRQMLRHVMQVEERGWPACCAYCDEPGVAIGEGWLWVCATHAPRCPCGEVAVGKGDAGWVCAEHWLVASYPPAG